MVLLLISKIVAALKVGRHIRAAGVSLCAGTFLIHTSLVAQDIPTLAIAVGEPGTASYRIGQGLVSALGTYLFADGNKQIEVWESLSPADRVTLLLDEVQIAVVPYDQPVPQDARQAIGVIVDAGAGHALLLRADLGERLVDEIVRVALERAKAADPRDLRGRLSR